ncbi:hypothetical protein CLV56_2349 [Mumia flava]|uniref:Uncharacterized protein n=1 Tax=Mumia flava TaxID=1348852 RepID=A0A0B2BVQ2_9ACTN|nr:hypothetical protein [Mumia flava]PJJ58104.1 hypothetical protein CLV56_2349 [Mumia flava]
MPTVRRRQRSARLLAASLLLAASAAFVAVAVVTASTAILIASSITAVVVGVVAARIVANEVMATRRAWYQDRAVQAQAYRDMTVDRTRENMEFVAAVNDTLAETTKRIVELNGTLRLAEARAEESDAKRADLEREVERARSDAEVPDLSSMVLWEGAEMPTIVDLLGWESPTAREADDDSGDEEMPEAKEA